MAVRSLDFNFGRLMAALSIASGFWWLETESGGLLGRRRTYLLLGIHPLRYPHVTAVGVHFLWLRLMVGWIHKDADVAA